jgi:hypothetical protein
MSKSRNYRDYDDDKFERRARRNLRNQQQTNQREWKFDPRKDYNREEWEEREQLIRRIQQ